ncbi:MAG: PAS domain S-box protein [Bacteroidetes bacterium]|nr:PAS domain S-box protein [Bacteroidota bacterium]
MKKKIKEKTPLKLLCLEDSPKDAEIVSELLDEAGFDLSIDCTDNKKEFTSLLKKNSYDVVISDFSLPGFDAFGALEILKKIRPEIPFICVSGSIGEETAIELIRNGAADYILKDRMVRLPSAIKHAIEIGWEKKLRMQAEEDLVENQRRFRTVFSATPVGTVIARVSDGKIIDANPAVKNILGYDYSELVGRTTIEIGVLADIEQHDKIMEFFNKKGSVRDFEVSYRNKSGETGFLLVSLDSIVLSGEKHMLSMFYDVTKRKKAEEALHESELRFRTTFEEANIGIIIVNTDGFIIKVNNEMSRILGYSREKLESKTTNDITYKEDLNLNESSFRKMLSGQTKKVRFDKRYVHKDGHVIWTHLSSTLVSDSSGKPLYFISHIQDITERKHAEEALRESEEKFRTFAEQSPNMIFIHNKGRIVYVNAKCEEMTGYTKEEFYSPGFNFTSIIAPEHVDIIHEFYKRHINGEDVPPYEYTIVTKAGERLEVINSTKLIPYENEKAILGIITDISELKRTEKLLLENQETINAIVETSQDWIWTMDSMGIHTYSNPAVKKILGYKPEEIIGKDCLNLLHEEDAEKIKNYIPDKIKSKNGWSNVLLRWRHKNGFYHYLESNAVPIFNDNDEVIGFRGVDRDITERKQIERYVEGISSLKQQLLGKRKLEEKLKLVTNSIVELFDADFARIWIIKEADLCEKGCIHAAVTEGPDVCRDRNSCLHLIASSGAYTDIDGSHMRVPIGSRKIGRIASGEEDMFLTNDVLNDDRIHDKEWAKSLNLVSFTGYKIMAENRLPIGVMALFRKSEIEEFEQKYLQDIADTLSQIILAGAAEEKLLNSEMRYRALVESQSDLISRYKPDTTITFVNDAYCKFYGKTREEFVGQSLLKWVEPEFRETAKKEAEDLPRNPRVLRGESLNYRYDGKKRWIEWIIQGITDEQGKVTELQAVGRDITEKKTMEKALQESEKNYRELIDGMNETVWIVDFEGNLIDVNKTALQVLGYNKEELLKIGLFGVDSSLKKEDIKTLAKSMPADKLQIFETTHKTKGGWIFPVEVYSSIVNYKGKKAILSIARDITERKRTEELARQKEQQFKTLFMSLDDGFYLSEVIYDDNGNPCDYRYLEINPKFEQMSGLSRDQIIGKRYKELVPGDTTQWFDNYCKVARTGMPAAYSFYSPEYKKHFETYSYQTAKGQISVFVRDVTRRVLMEEQLRQIQKMEGLGTLAGGIAHDFNNILGIILAYNTGIKRFKGDPKKMEKATDTITKAVDRGKAIVQQILTFARKTETSFESVNINEVVMEIMTMIYETFPKTLTYTQNFGKGMPFINADRSQLYQALLNLCVNARDAMSNGGLLTINTRVVPGASLNEKHADVSDTNYVCIEVSDTGEGMSDEVKKRIFEPFFTTKGIGKGTGLGLAVVFGVVQTHKGFAEVESELGKGTTFRLYIPAIQAADPEIDREEEKLEDLQGGTETLLVVEDEEMLIMSLQMVLFEKGYNVLTASDGLEALKVYRENKNDISLVMTDLGLPGMTGLEVCQKIKQIKPDERVVLATGYLDPDMKTELVKAGIEHFLFKPYDLRKVLKTVREILDGK